MPDVQNSQPAAPNMPQTGAGPQTDFTDPMSLFDAMEKEFFPKDETAPDFRGMKPGKDLNDDEFMNFDPSAKDEQTNEASTDETQALSEGGEVTDDKAAPAKDEFKNFEFEEEIGGQRVHLNIKTPEQLQNVIRRAVIAQNLYEENAKFKAELPALQEAHEYMQDFDRMIEDDPASFISMILEEMPVADVKQLIMNLADAHSKDDGEIERDRRIKKSEYLERKLERLAEREQKLVENQKVAARDADLRALRSWSSSVTSKLATKIPEQYHEMVKQQIRNTILEGRQRQGKGERITLRALDSILQRNVKPLLELANVGSKTGSKVDAEMGRRMQAQKQTNLTHVRDAASTMQKTGGQPAQKSKMRQAVERDDIYGALAEMESLIDGGHLRIREG